MQERHNIIQNIAKEKKGSTLISGFESEGKILQGPEMYEKLFEEVEKMKLHFHQYLSFCIYFFFVKSFKSHPRVMQ